MLRKYSISIFKSIRHISESNSYPTYQNRKRYCTSSASSFASELFTENSSKIEKYLENVAEEYYQIKNSENATNSQQYRRMSALGILIDAASKRNELKEYITTLSKEMKGNNKDKELIQAMEEEQVECRDKLKNLNENILELICKCNDDTEDCSSIMLEVSTGVGGQEAMLFARELYDMYMNYTSFKGWETDILHEDDSDLGGLRHASVIVYGKEVYNTLKFEAGVHRVQRIPTTEKSGRLHTSTVTIAVIPRFDDVDLNVKQIDLKIETKKASGAGGQHVNTTDSAVRIVHLPTGIAVECQTERSQIKNKALAIKKLQAKLCHQHYEAEMATQQATRKGQVGSSLRNEKIRTYNYNQDRITDHRIKSGTIHNLNGFLQGNKDLDNLIHDIQESKKIEDTIELIKNIM